MAAAAFPLPPPLSFDAAAGPVGGRPLLVSVLAALAAVITATTAILFFSIDHLVSRQFGQLHEDRVTRLGELVRAGAERELERLAGTARLLAQDADLNHSTYYHLFLEGEVHHPRAALERMAAAFRIGGMTLWSASGEPIARTPAADWTPPERADAPGGRVVRRGDRAWAVAAAPLVRNGQAMAWLQLERPLDEVVDIVGARALGASVEVSSAGSAADGALPVRLGVPADSPVVLAVRATDVAATAIAEIKRLLAVALAASAAVSALLLALFLRWQLRPLVALAAAASAVGRGEFGRTVAALGGREVNAVVQAFNAMSRDLGKLRERERKASHDEQLAAIGRVAARVAHDINNPLTVISSAAELVRRQVPADSPAAADAALILHHGERCRRTVEALLEFGRPVRLHPERLDLAAIAGEVAERWRRQRELANGPAIDVIGPVPVEGDRYELERVLENLLENGLAAGGDRGLRVSVARREGEALLEVSDRGPGFSEAAIRHLFEPFFTTRQSGNGLGLASVLAIARAHGGNVTVSPAPEGGARVSVSLPLAG